MPATRAIRCLRRTITSIPPASRLRGGCWFMPSEQGRGGLVPPFFCSPLSQQGAVGPRSNRPSGPALADAADGCMLRGQRKPLKPARQPERAPKYATPSSTHWSLGGRLRCGPLPPQQSWQLRRATNRWCQKWSEPQGTVFEQFENFVRQQARQRRQSPMRCHPGSRSNEVGSLEHRHQANSVSG